MNFQTEALGQDLYDFFMQAPFPLAILLGPEHRYFLANQSYEALVQREIIGKTVSEAFAHEGVEPYVRVLDEVFRTGRPHIGNELPFWEKFFNIGFYPFRESDGTIKGVLIFNIEVTDHVKARQLVEKSELRYKLLSNCIPQLSWSTDSAGYIDYVNDNWLKYTGQTIEESIGSGWLRAIHTEDAPHVEEAWSRATSSGVEYRAEFRLKNKNGGYGWFSAHGVPMRDDHGKVTRWFGTNTDISEYRKREARKAFLDKATRLLSNTLDYGEALKQATRLAVPLISDWAIIDLLEKDGSITRLEAYHHDPEKQSAAETMRKYPPTRSRANDIWQVIATGKPSIRENISLPNMKDRTVNEEHYLLTNVLGITSFMVMPLQTRNNVLGTLSFCNSSTDRIFSEEDISLAEEFARRASMALDNARLYQEALVALGSRDEFISIASHELKTPLTALMLQQQLIQLHLNNPKEHIPLDTLAKLARESGKQVAQLNRLIDDLLNVSRIQTGRLTFRFQEVDVSSVVAEVVERIIPHLTIAKSTIHLDLTDRLIAHWDRDKIEQVIWNLVSNASKYASGSELKIKTSKTDLNARIEAQDKGPGIPKELQADIFECFERGKPKAGTSGLGLGLYIVKKIAEGHGGKVWVESTPNSGSNFIVELPLIPPAVS